MLDRDVEKLLGELCPEELSADADERILAAIRNAHTTTPAGIATPIAVYQKPVPAWAALAACMAVSAASWSIGARSVLPSNSPRRAERVEPLIEGPAISRVHVESSIFVASPKRELDITQWSPVSAANSESRS